jgi:glutamine synthetase
MTTGMLTLAQLKKEVTSGAIDTVVAAFPDMQGRLMGKRFHAEYFADGAHDETHGCNYLLADDIDMEPVPGYKAASWEKGYGDFVLKRDLATMRVTPWLEKTALVLCDILDHHQRYARHATNRPIKLSLPSGQVPLRRSLVGHREHCNRMCVRNGTMPSSPPSKEFS